MFKLSRIFHFKSKKIMRKLAIGDIHGCNKTFQALLNQINLTKDDELTLLGDYIDRGKDSKGVIDTILALQSTGYNVRTLRGNHEQMMLDTLNFNLDISDMGRWEKKAGGNMTLASFGDTLESYIPFFESLPLIFVDKDFIFVHAGLNFKKKDPLSDKSAFLWIRDFYDTIDAKWLKNRLIVHGHTPIPLRFIEEDFEHLTKKRFPRLQALNLDAGCVFGMGNLVAADLTNNKLYIQPKEDEDYILT